MSRLLFAAARGARMQRQHEHLFHKQVWWEDVRIQWGLDDELRIHPDDEHLAYGPISTALRNDALGLPLTETCWFANLELRSDGDLYTLSPNDRYVFLLLMAEALADEGM